MASLALSSPVGDISEARQRRRRSTKRRGSRDLAQTDPDVQNVIQLRNDESSSVVESEPGGVQRKATARERRVRARSRRSGEDGQTSHQHTLEDSTAGVADLLHKIESSNDIMMSHTPAEEEVGGVHSSKPHPQQQDKMQETQYDRPLPEPITAAQSDTNLSAESQATPSSNEILSLTIHGTDLLKASVSITHPLVRVSVIDTETGHFAKKSNPETCVTSYYESSNPTVDYILPVLTQPYTSVHSSSLKPAWGETIILNEQIHHFRKNRILFFELLDFPSSWVGDHIREGSAPWFKIAWAFLQPSEHLIGQKCRLQLYKYEKKFRCPSDSVEVYALWARHCRKRYPSTLYVSLVAIPPLSSSDYAPDHAHQPHLRSMDPTQEECSSITYEQFLLRQQRAQSGSNLLAETPPLATPLTRLPGQRCRLPTLTHALLHPSRDGCSVVRFSHSGRLLAVGGASSNHAYPLIIIEVSSFTPVLCLEGHRGIIYDVTWSEDDITLVSASADGLVKIWSVSTGQPEPLHTLPHPCYVYCVCQCQSAAVFTGAYDGRIRYWTTANGSVQLLGELVCDGGCGLVNSLVWQQQSQTLFSGHSSGVVAVWQRSEEAGEGSGGSWQLHRQIKAIAEGVLTSISLHPSGRKLLAQSDRGRLVMIDLRIDRVCCEYRGVYLSASQRCCSLISPCGEMVFASGEGERVLAWNTDNGKLLHTFSDLPFKSPISSVAFHPTNHMLVVACFAPHQPLLALVAGEGGEGVMEAAMKNQQLGHRLDSVNRTLNKVTDSLLL